MKLKNLGILPWVLAAIALGILCSLFFPVWAVRIFATFNSIFSNFLGMFIPLLIMGLVAPAIADLGKQAGSLLLITAAIAYLSTVISGTFGYLTSRALFPTMLSGQMAALGEFSAEGGILPYFTIEMPAFISVTTALVIAFILGLGCAAIPGRAMKGVLDDFRDIVSKTIAGVIIPCLPVFIFGIFLKMGSEGKVTMILGMFIKIILVMLCMELIVLTVKFCIAGIISGKNPFKSLLKMLPAYATAIGTQSSAATIPTTLQCTKNLGVKSEVAEFTIPLCANIHMPGSIIELTCCSFAVSLSLGTATDFGTFIGFILMLAITVVAAPGIPGGAVMASLGVMSSILGFDTNMQGLVIAIYVAMDSFGTACNVTGDGAISLIVDRFSSWKRQRQEPVSDPQ